MELSIEKQLAKKEKNRKKRQKRKLNRIKKRAEFQFDTIAGDEGYTTTNKKKSPGQFAKRHMEDSKQQSVREDREKAVANSQAAKEATEQVSTYIFAFITNLSYQCDANALETHLKKIVGNEAVRKVKIDLKSNKPTGRALVTLANRAAFVALQQEDVVVMGRKIRINENNFTSFKILSQAISSAVEIPLISLDLVSNHKEHSNVYASITSNSTVKIDSQAACQFQFIFKVSDIFYRVDFSLKDLKAVRFLSQNSLEVEFDSYPFCYRESDIQVSSAFSDLFAKMKLIFATEWTADSELNDKELDTGSEKNWIRCQDPLAKVGGGFSRILCFRLEFSPSQFSRAIKLFRKFNLKIEPMPKTPMSHSLRLDTGALDEWRNDFSDYFEGLSFPVRFLISALISRNSICLSSASALELNGILFEQRELLVLQVLEDLFSKARVYDPISWLREEFKCAKEESDDSDAEEDTDFEEETDDSEDVNGLYIRRVYITPLRVCPQLPEWDSANRIIRNYIQFKTRFIRVTFTDENFATIMTANTDPVFERISKIVLDGFVLAGRKFEFLAYSSSQLREASCWFFDQSKNRYPGERSEAPTINDIRESMGGLSGIRVVGKFAARLGQGFSTSVQTVSVSEEELEEIPDVERNNYCFSDGVGMISMQLAREVSKYLQVQEVIDRTPSAFQIRFRGCKGVVSVAPKGVLNAGTNLAIRKSMKKFVGNASHRSLEVLAVSNPIKCYLNRQNIAILSSLGVDDQVFMNLLERMLDDLNSALEDNESAKRLIYNNSVQSNTALMMLASGCDVRKDPHLFGLVLAARNKLLLDLELKARILVKDGISLIGIMDETREKILPEGCIFFQYTDSDGEIIKRKPGTKVTVCRNPCLHPGDVRVLTVFHSPLLEHLVNVVVFSQHGYRPNPNEMSGGDLDGDIYSVIFDRDLIPTRTEAAMDYSPPSPPKTLDETVDDTKIKEFYVSYLRNDNLGRIANAHMVFADLEKDGALSENCLKLAELHSTAVDFNKTGVPAKFPQELFVRKYPQFMGKPPQLSYRSEKVLGKVYDRVVNLGTSCTIPPELTKVDNDFFVDGYSHFLYSVWFLMDLYNEELWHLMEKFDVRVEAEAVSGYCAQFSRKKSRIRGDDAASKFFLEVRKLQNEIWNIFFEELGIDTENMVLERLNEDDRLRALQKASASYFVCYDQYFDPQYPLFLSFCWIFYKLLCWIKKESQKLSTH